MVIAYTIIEKSLRDHTDQQLKHPPRASYWFPVIYWYSILNIDIQRIKSILHIKDNTCGICLSGFQVSHSE